MPKKNFKAVVNDYSAQVLNIAMRILGDAQKAQDVHQEVFLAIWQRWHKYNSRINWEAYAEKTYYQKHGKYNLKMWLTNKRSTKDRYYIISGN